MTDRPQLAAPRAASPETAWRPGLLATCALAISALVLVAALVGGGEELAGEIRRLRWWLTGLVLALELGVWLLLRRDRPDWAAGLQLIGGWAALGFTLAVFGGAGSPGLGGYVFLVAIGSLLWPARAGLAYAALCGASMLALAWAEAAGTGLPLVPAAGSTRLNLWAHALVFALVAVLMHRVAGLLRGTLSRQQAALRDLDHSRGHLEQEVARRTAALSEANTQLRTAAETAEQLGAILDPERLMRETVARMQERFGLYHVHVYLIDRDRGQLVVRAGTGQPGRRMVAAGHAIPLAAERSLVARAAREERVVLVDDVAEEPRHLPNPLLPATRSEVAVPLRARDGVIGVLDVQDDQPGRFGAADLDTFGTLAGQIGVAIENARLFAEMQKVMERLREVDRLKSEFLANMSHELRTPLNSIIGYAELMLMGLNGELNAESGKDVQAIYDNGQQLLTLINDLLDLAKIEAGRMRLEAEEVLPGPLLEEARTRSAGLLLRRPVEMLVEVEPGLPVLRVDRLRIEQVLTNLVSNAVKFTDEGRIWLRAYRDGEEVCLEVEDTGIGIDAASLEGIFEKFRQVDGSFTRRAKGTGLGLAISRHLVEMHGGRIEVRSQPGQGSVFTVRLPIVPAEETGTLRALFGLARAEQEA